MLYTFTAAADNYEPAPRNYLSGTLAVYEMPAEQTGRTLARVLCFSSDVPKQAHHAIYLLDDGSSVTAYYVAGWRPDLSEIYLQTFPLNDGTIRPDNGRPVDFSGWLLGPRTAFHLKLSAAAQQPAEEQQP